MSGELTQWIRDTIATRGPATFRWFMEQALYHPEHGYYSSGKASIGKGGDFFTNVSVGPLFGRLLSRQFTEIWERMGRGAPFSIVEQGANDGQFALDVLETVRELASDIFRAMDYRIIEPFEVNRRRQKEKLGGFAGKVSWRGSMAELEPFGGIHFSNELLDAMPVHLLVLRDGGWKERCVDWRDGAFAFVEIPIHDERLRRFAAEMEGPFREGAEVEVNLDALGWIETLAAKLERGYVLTIDYGDADPPARFWESGQGTLACYRAHRRMDDPLCEPGEIDITARVDFGAVARAAARSGLMMEGFTDQHHFMTGLIAEGFPNIGSKSEKLRRSLAFNQLSHPNLMGTHFKVLCLRKNMESGVPLRGFALGARQASL